ncbi:15063_t:CDS:1, partial [Racocetra persica]
ITVTPCYTLPLLNTPPFNTQNLIDPFDYYIQNQDTTIVRPNSPQRFKEINLQPIAEE